MNQEQPTPIPKAEKPTTIPRKGSYRTKKTRAEEMAQEEIDKAFIAAGGIPKPRAGSLTLGPGSYKPEYCQMLIDFFNKPPTRQVPETWYHTDGSVKRETMRDVANPPPHLGQFAMKIGVWAGVLHEWAKDHQDFALALMQARSLRKHMVIDNALQGLYNPIFAKLAAANWFNWREQAQVNHTGEVRSIMVQYHKPDRDPPPLIDRQTPLLEGPD